MPEDCGGPGYVRNTEVEPSITVNPKDRNNIAITWQQDRFDGPGALGIVVAVSKDGGRRWRRVVVPGLSDCTGGTYARVRPLVVLRA